VVVGFKGSISENEALTGKDFCDLVGINFDDINKRIALDQEANREYLFNSIRIIRNKYHKEKA
jgi:hypothetical protein